MARTESTPDLSFVVPLYNTGDGLLPLLGAFRTLSLPESWELVLVDDGSTDGTALAASRAVAEIPAHVTLVELARNFGEHAAVLEGCRHARGTIVVNLDDDLQNPLSEATKLFRHLRKSDAEVVYSRYAEKKHHWARNLASWLANCCATHLLGKPSDLYLSSFRAMRRELVGRIVLYRGPYPYVDGLILGATNRIATLEVAHAGRSRGGSGYTLRKLIRLALSLLFDFSGAQLLLLGLIGEYVGRAFLTVSGKPQSIVRSLMTHDKPFPA